MRIYFDMRIVLQYCIIKMFPLVDSTTVALQSIPQGGKKEKVFQTHRFLNMYVCTVRMYVLYVCIFILKFVL